MSLEGLVAAVCLLGMIIYGVLGGADFGGGVWDLFANGPRREEQRAAIARAMGPVWEANHVWLIFVIVVVFTAFPRAYAALSIGLYGVFHVVLVGITLRGAAFVFRGAGGFAQGAGHWGIGFGIASLLTPLLLGMAVGAVSSGSFRVVDGQVEFEGATPWITPIALLIGSLALAICAFLAAVFLTNETQAELREDFRRQALAASAVVACLALLTLPILYVEAPHLWSGLFHRGAGIVVAVGVAAAGYSAWALRSRRYLWARRAAILEAASLQLGWGLAQYPYLIYPDVTLANAAGPDQILRFILWLALGGAVVLAPSLWLLLRVFKGEQR